MTSRLLCVLCVTMQFRFVAEPPTSVGGLKMVAAVFIHLLDNRNHYQGSQLIRSGPFIDLPELRRPLCRRIELRAVLICRETVPCCLETIPSILIRFAGSIWSVFNVSICEKRYIRLSSLRRSFG
jgi:hypothetical protein